MNSVVFSPRDNLNLDAAIFTSDFEEEACWAFYCF